MGFSQQQHDSGRFLHQILIYLFSIATVFMPLLTVKGRKMQKLRCLLQEDGNINRVNETSKCAFLGAEPRNKRAKKILWTACIKCGDWKMQYLFWEKGRERLS